MTKPKSREPTPFGRVQEAAIKLLEADNDDEYRAARERLRYAARDWLKVKR